MSQHRQLKLNDGQKHIDVTIVSYNNSDTIQECIASVRHLGSVDKIIVVDHGSDDTTKQATLLGAEAIQDPTNPGYGQGQNHAVKLCESSFILLLNPDAKIVPEAILQGLEYLTKHDNVAAIQGIIKSFDETVIERSHGNNIGLIHLYGRAMGLKRLLKYSFIRRIFSNNNLLKDHVNRIPTEPVKTEALGFVAVLMRRSAFESVGGFDRSFFMYGEDMDLCKRLTNKGYELISLPTLWALHLGQYSSGSNFNTELLWWQGTLRYAYKWWSTHDKLLLMVAQVIEFLKLSIKQPGEIKTIYRHLFLK